MGNVNVFEHRFEVLNYALWRRFPLAISDTISFTVDSYRGHGVRPLRVELTKKFRAEIHKSSNPSW
jgi:hypothetical protein